MLFGGAKKASGKKCNNGKLPIGVGGRCVTPKVKKPCKRTGHFRQTMNGPCVKSKKINNNKVSSMNKLLSSKHMNNRKGKTPCPPGSELVKVGSKKASCRKKCPVGKSRNAKGRCVNDKSNSNIYAEMANLSETKETSLGRKSNNNNNKNNNNKNNNNNNNRVLSLDEMNEIADKLNVYNHSKTVNHRKSKTPCKSGKELITVNKKSSCRKMCNPGFVRKSNGQCVNPKKRVASPKQLASLSKGRKLRKDKKAAKKKEKDAKNEQWYRERADLGAYNNGTQQIKNNSNNILSLEGMNAAIKNAENKEWYKTKADLGVYNNGTRQIKNNSNNILSLEDMNAVINNMNRTAMKKKKNN